MNLPHLALLVALSLSSSCVLAVGNKGLADPQDLADAEASAAAESDAAAEVAAAEREVSAATLDLELARRKGENAVAAQREELKQKAAARVAAQAELQVFVDLERPHKLASAELELDEAKNSVWEAEQELSELQAMYSKEQFAERAKELVLGRGEKHLALAKRRLELAQAERKALEQGELRAKETELQEGLRKAEAEQGLAQQALSDGEFEAKADLEKARFELVSKERALARVKQAAAKAQATQSRDAKAGA
jgi:hypothetical protein